MYYGNIQMLIAASNFGSSLSASTFLTQHQASASGVDVTGVKGHGLRAPSSGGLLVSSLCPASFPLRYNHRKIQIICQEDTQWCLFPFHFPLCKPGCKSQIERDKSIKHFDKIKLLQTT